MSKLITVPVREELDYYEFWRWCNQHCQGRFYTGTNWDLSVWQPRQQNRIVQFELEIDATMFALKWA